MEEGNRDCYKQHCQRRCTGELIEVPGGHIVRATGRKDRHSKVYTAKGVRDRRVRLSAHTAIQFYDVQDRLGYDRPSKAVDWLMQNAKTAIDQLADLSRCHEPVDRCVVHELPLQDTSVGHDSIELPMSDAGAVASVGYGFGSSSSSLIPPSIDGDAIDGLVKPFPTVTAAASLPSSHTMTYHDYTPDLLLHACGRPQDLGLSLRSFHDPTFRDHHHQSPESTQQFFCSGTPNLAHATTWETCPVNKERMGCLVNATPVGSVYIDFPDGRILTVQREELDSRTRTKATIDHPQPKATMSYAPPAGGNGNSIGPPDYPSQDGYSIRTSILSTVLVLLALVVAVIVFVRLYVRYVLTHRSPGDDRRRRRLAAIDFLRFHMAADALPQAAGLDPSAIAALPAFAYQMATGGEGEGSVAECAVCLSTVEEGEMVRLLPTCKHLFHVGCIDMWLACHVTCPVCRAMVEPPAAAAVDVGETSTPQPPSLMRESSRAEGTSAEETSGSKEGSSVSSRLSASLRRMLSRERSTSMRSQGVAAEDLERQ
ncbi:unnamed protein product [Musa textilis]